MIKIIESIGKAAERALKSNTISEKILAKKTDNFTIINRVLVFLLIALISFLLWERSKGKGSRSTNTINETYKREYKPKFRTEYRFKNCSKEEVREAVEAISEQQKKIAIPIENRGEKLDAIDN